MRITFVDAPTFLPQSVANRLRNHGEVFVYDDSPSTEQIEQRLNETDVAIVEQAALPAPVFRGCQRLRHVVLPTTGYGRVDVQAANAAGVVVSNTRDYCQNAVAEHAIGMLLAVSKRLIEADALVREDPRTSYVNQSVGLELRGARLGVVGFGGIGRAVANLGHNLGMEAVFYNRSKRKARYMQLPLDALMTSSPFVVVCLPLNEETRGIISPALLANTLPGTVIVGISGSRLFDEAAITELLSSGHLFGVGIDGPTGERLHEAPHLLQSPDCGWLTNITLSRNIELVAETIELGLGGQYRFVV